MKLFGIPYNSRQLYYIVGDAIIALIAIYIAYLLRFGLSLDGMTPLGILETEAAASIFFISSNLVVLFIADAYNTTIDFRRPQELIRLWLAVGVALILQVISYFIFPEDWWGRGIAGLTSLSFGVLLSAWRPAVGWVKPGPVFRLKTLVVGDEEAGHIITDVIASNPEHRQVYQLVGLLDHPRFGHRRSSDHTPTPVFSSLPPNLSLLGNTTDLKKIVTRHQVDLVIVAIRGSISSNLAKQLLECKAAGVQVEEMPTLYKKLTGKVPILHLSDNWLIFGPVFAGTSRLEAALQRVMDIILSLIGLVISAPVIALGALAVKLESPGPAFYLQERLGRNEVPFRIIKLRTMRQDAEATTGAVWSKGASDPRITRVGRILRRTRIDELPQFYNVLRGDMAIIGPRPEREFFVKQLKEEIPFYALRFSVKPGVTGWAQVSYHYGASKEESAEKLCYELFAIQELSPVLYAMILLKTVQTMLLKAGS
jgi:exopolysaccharide biosynthesis polyprenyl glycosylphosphotransferase